MKVSVIIPVYNVEKYLEECLNSVINQTLRDIEIICVDDCSTDKSFNILKEYEKKDSRVRLFKNERNTGGPSVGRNLGIDSALGKYIYFIDADDYISNDYIENLYITAEKYNSDIISNLNIYEVINDCIKPFQPEVYNNIEKWKKEYPNNYLEGESILSIKNEYEGKKEFLSLVVWNKLYRLDFIKNNNLYFMPSPIEKDDGSEDIHFYYKLVLNEPKTSYNHKGIYYYRQIDSSIMKSLKTIEPVYLRLKDCINYTNSNHKEKLCYLIPSLFKSIYYRFSILTDKIDSYKYIHNFANEINIDKNLLSKNNYLEYSFIKLNDSYDKYLVSKDLYISLINNYENEIRKVDNWIKFIGIYNTFDSIIFVFFFIRVKIKLNYNSINKIAWFIPFRKCRDIFRSKFKIDQTRPDQTRPDQTRPDLIFNIYYSFL